MLVSVIVPVYNAREFLARCVDSLLAQTHRDIEVLLIDDGSTDGGGALCDRYAATDPRVKAFHQDNAGPSAARNLGLERARGERVMFVDADDFIDAGAAAVLLESMDEAKAGLAVCAYKTHIFAGGKERFSGILPVKVGTLSLEQFLSLETLALGDAQAVRARAHITGNIWGRLYRLDLIRKSGLKFDAALNRYEDILFNVSYLAAAGRLAVIDKPLYHYCVYEGRVSLSDRVTKTKFAMAKASYDGICRRLEGKSGDYIRFYFAYILMGYLIRLFQAGSPFTFREAWRELRAVCTSPMYKDVMPHYRRPQDASVFVPFFLRLRLFLLASAAAKARMLKATLGKKPVRQWCVPAAATAQPADCA